MSALQNAPIPAKLLPNVDLSKRNSFGFSCQAQWVCEIDHADQIPRVMSHISEQQLAWRVLGGGSNVILPATLPGVTLLMNIAGQEIVSSDSQDHYLAVGAGVNWHELVQWTLANELPGLENLALIPGTVGAAPIQNIGAYGVEIGQYINQIEAFDTQQNTFARLSNAQCAFAYRDSYFKKYPQRFIVSKVIFKLPRVWQARLHYADLAKYFATNSQSNPSPQDIFLAVCAIRKQKLPDPKVIGNAGSFFQNPIVANEQYETLLKTHPHLVSYPDAPGKRKLAAGWLIDQCHFKGQRMGNVGVYEKQALVLVNYGGGSAQDILGLAKCIRDQVHDTFGVTLEIEPNLL